MPKRKYLTNKNKVPLKQWRRWSDKARQVFNQLFETMQANQALFVHPEAVEVPGEQWETVAWNASWMAADAVDGDMPDIVIDVTPGGEEVSRPVKKAA